MARSTIALVAIGSGSALLLYWWRRRSRLHAPLAQSPKPKKKLRRRVSLDHEQMCEASPWLKCAGSEHSGMKYPCYVMRMDDFLALDRLLPHGELVSDGRVVPMLPEELEEQHVNFISHQWLDTETADPAKAHLRTMQDVFRRVAAGENVFRSDEEWATYAKGYSKLNKGVLEKCDRRSMNLNVGEDDLLQAEAKRFRRSVAQGLVWFDFISVPQTVCCRSAEARQRALLEQGLAIASIPAYVRHASNFWICAPGLAPHSNGGSCSYDTWAARGWCRLEETAFSLTGKKKKWSQGGDQLGDGRPLLVTQPLGHAPQVRTLDMMDRLWVHSQRRSSVLNGDYSCCRMGHVVTDAAGRRTEIPCDKPRLQLVLQRILDERVAEARRLMLRDPLQHGARPLWECATRSFQTDRAFWTHYTLRVLGPLWLAGAEADGDGDACAPPADDGGVATADELRAFAEELGVEWPECGPALCVPAAVRSEQRVLRRLLTVEKVDGSVAHEGAFLGQTPLAFAARYGNLPAVDLLTSVFPGAAHVNRASEGLGLWPLGEAAKCGHPACVAMLLARGADVNQRRRNGQTALHQAAANGHPECVRLLCDAGADPLAVDENGHTVAALAAAELDFRPAVKAMVLGELLSATGVSFAG